MITNPKIEFWYDKPIEVDPINSWLANSPYLIANSTCYAYEDCPYSKVLALIEYTRPDFTLTVNSVPILCCETTKEIPTGNNIPQRFPGLLRPAELGVPSIFYFLKSARKNTSSARTNPPLNVNVRVMLAQMRLSDIYNVPSLTMFMPTDPATLLPTSKISDLLPLAQMVEQILNNYLATEILLPVTDSIVIRNRQEQINAINDILNATSGRGYNKNSSYRSVYRTGSSFIGTVMGAGFTFDIDPPKSCKVEDTANLLSAYYTKFGKNYSHVQSQQKVKRILNRKYSLVYHGTANKAKTGPEHPFPGVLTLLDILYARKDSGQTTRDREFNVVFELPITLASYKDSAFNKPTGLNILMRFCDLIVLDDAIVIGGWMLNVGAGAVLVK